MSSPLNPENDNVIDNNVKRLDTVNKGIKLSRWSIFGLVFFIAAFTILFVNNVMMVDNLLKENRALEKKYQSINNSNKVLTIRIDELQSADRIIMIAKNKLGMIKPEYTPKIIPDK